MTNLIEDPSFIDESTVPFRPIAIKYGLLGTLASATIGLVMYIGDMLNPADNKATSLISVLVFVVVIVMSIREHKRDDLKGFISFKRAFSVGMSTTLVVALLSAIWNYIFMAFIAPDMMDTIKNVQMQAMADKGMGEEEIEQAMEVAKVFMSPGMISFMSIFGSLIMGGIIAPIASAIMKNKA